MLCLSRNTSETILIGDKIKIKILQVKGKTAMIGIEAPVEIKILRGELENQERNDNETIDILAWCQRMDADGPRMALI